MSRTGEYAKTKLPVTFTRRKTTQELWQVRKSHSFFLRPRSDAVYH
jgi:1,2-phenylacetyl-CoA epoxidase PaaB subunit